MQKQLTMDPRVELPAIRKSVLITIDESITDDYILGIVSALVGIETSAFVKHDALIKPKRAKQDMTFVMHLRFPQSVVDRGIDLILSKVLKKYTLNKDVIEQVEYEQILTLENIKEIAGPSGRCFAQAGGILTGAEAVAVFDLKPVVAHLNKSFDNQVLVYKSDYGIVKELDEFLLAHSFVKVVINPQLFRYEEMLQEVVDSQMVIGPPSFYTYAAACLDIPCIEICESREQLLLMSKWSSVKYSAVLKEEIEHFNAARLESAWKHWFGINQRDVNLVLDSDG